MITKNDWERFFPYPNVRPEQEQAINFILTSFLSNSRFCLCELGTGVGKSAIAITVAGYMNSLTNQAKAALDVEKSVGTYVLTTQKVLQDQYVNDFGSSKFLMRSVKSASNYCCGFYPDQSCGESRRVLHQLRKQLQGTEFYKHCTKNCVYAIEKKNFIDSPTSVTNFSYFLAETNYAKKLLPRELLIIDEAHNIEQELSKFIEVVFSERFSKTVLKCKLPSDMSQDNVFDWIKTTYKKKLEKQIRSLQKTLAKNCTGNSLNIPDGAKQYEMLDKHICKVNRFIETYSKDNWVMNVVQPLQSQKNAMRKIEFKPIDVSFFSEDNLFRFGDRILMMSATIIDKESFCTSLGLNPADVSYLSIPSPFPIENRMVHFVPSGSMSLNSIDKTLPNIVEAIKLLLERHQNEKGILHCVNFRVARYIVENVSSARLLIHNSENREQILKQHINSTEPTVLVSPSMTEGVNLADDISRFQILCKIPYPYIGDEVVKRRMKKDKRWYAYQTAKSIIQSLGRSIRNENDHAISYILDSDWESFYKFNRSMFSSEFHKTIA